MFSFSIHMFTKNKKKEECCVCFKDTENVIAPCLHVMCKECILIWCSKKIKCPICNTTVLSPCRIDNLTKNIRTTQRITIHENTPLGLALKEVSEGLYVLCVDEASVGESLGFRAQQIITHVNDIPITGLEDMKTIFRQASHTHHPLQFTLLRPLVRPSSQRLFSCFHYKVFPV